MMWLASFYNLLATSLFAGATFAAWVAIYPTTHALGASEYARVEKSLIQHFNPLMPILGITAPICAAYLLIANRQDWGTRPYAIFLAGFIFCMISGIVSGPIDIPANKEVLSWSVDSPPADWEKTRQRLTKANHARTLSAVLSLICYLWAIHLGWPRF